MKWNKYPDKKPIENTGVLTSTGISYQVLRYQEGYWNSKEFEVKGVKYWCYIVPPKRKRSTKKWLDKLRRMKSEW